jgi:hypothetical protein
MKSFTTMILHSTLLATVLATTGCLTTQDAKKLELPDEPVAAPKPVKLPPAMTKVDADAITETNADDSLKQIERELHRESGGVTGQKESR